MSTTSRRSFLSGAVAAGAALPLGHGAVRAATLAAAVPSAASEPQRILVLGGTGFLGPHFVRRALQRGHQVTLFHRGRTGSGLFPELEHLKGDREQGDLEALKGREFDVVVDTSGYLPSHVEATAGMFAKSARQYVFVSSVSVYPDFGQGQGVQTEATPVLTVSDEEVAQVKTIRDSMRHYGALKARCEAAAEAAMPGRVANIRPGLIVGPGDTSDRFTWWPVRIDQGGEVLCPGDQDANVQFIDARDLAEWMVHVLEQGHCGVFNADGFAGALSMAELLAGCKCATANSVTLTWASEEFLQANKVGPWMEMPLWIPREGRSDVDCSKARSHGLSFRPVADTIRDTLRWAKEERGDRPFARTGLKPEREQELLELLRQQAGR